VYDPFDRLLIAQAEHLSVPLITGNPAMSAYGVPILW
jgi:PIN domain nuclease of toxin-antitoxin system